MFSYRGEPLREIPLGEVERAPVVGSGMGIAPDGRLHVLDSGRIVVYEPDGSLAGGRVFFDMTAARGEDAIDGVKVDEKGNVYVSGPGGIWVLSADGRHLGTIRPPKHAHNFAWGGADGKTLYLCARDTLYRMPLRVAGVRP